MKKGEDGTGTITEVEPHQDVEHDEADGGQQRDDAVVTQLLTRLGTDRAHLRNAHHRASTELGIQRLTNLGV